MIYLLGRRVRLHFILPTCKYLRFPLPSYGLVTLISAINLHKNNDSSILKWPNSIAHFQPEPDLGLAVRYSPEITMTSRETFSTLFELCWTIYCWPAKSLVINVVQPSSLQTLAQLLSSLTRYFTVVSTDEYRAVQFMLIEEPTIRPQKLSFRR